MLFMVQLAGMLLGVLVGVACDGFGLRRSMLFGHWVLFAASLGGMWARQPSDLLVLRALEGVGFLLVVLPAPSLIRQLVNRHQLPRFLGFCGAYCPQGLHLLYWSDPS